MRLRLGQLLGWRARVTRAREGRPWRGTFTRSLCVFLSLTVTASANDLPQGWAAIYDQHLQQQDLTGETWLILRYIAPEIARTGGSLAYDDVVPGLDALCETDGLAAAAAQDTKIDQIVITVMDRPVEWGVATPDATMFLSAYLPTAEGCVWQ